MYLFWECTFDMSGGAGVVIGGCVDVWNARERKRENDAGGQGGIQAISGGEVGIRRGGLELSVVGSMVV